MSLALSIVSWVITVAFIVATIAGLWMTFKKAGESGWKAIIPFYNIYILFRIGGHSGWWLLILFLPVLVIFLGVLLVEMPAVISPEMDQLPGSIALLMNLFFITAQISIVVSAIMLYDVVRSFGKGFGFTIGISVLPFIFWPILGFGEAEYRGPVAHPKMVAKGSGAHLPVEKKDTTPAKEESKEKKEEKNSETKEN